MRGSWRGGARRAVWMAGVVTPLALWAVPATANAAPAPSALFAYAGGLAASPAACPRTPLVHDQCTLAQALALSGPGTSVLLATPGAQASYFGDQVLATAGTTDADPVTLGPAPGVAGVTLDGDFHAGVPCPTAACDGAMLGVRPWVHAVVEGLTFTDEDNTAGTAGGAIDDAAASLTVTGDTFDAVGAPDGGAVDLRGGGTLAVSGSTFTGDGANDGGAIDVQGGRATVTGSTFSQDTAGTGGAVDVGDGAGTGTLTLDDSTISGGGAVDGGAAAVGLHGGHGALAIRSSLLYDNGASDGGAVDVGDLSGAGSLDMSDSALWDNGAGDGGAVDVGDHGGQGTLHLFDSALASDGAADGGTIDAGDHRGQGSVVVEESTITGGQADVGGALELGGPGGGAGAGLLVHDTVVDNGGVAAVDVVAGSLVAAATVVAGSGPADCAGAVTDAGYNLEDDAGASCGFSPANHSVAGVDPALGPLENNGGPTETMLPAPGSPLLGQVPDPASITVSGLAVALCPVRDQRGVSSGAGACTIGSVN